MNLTIIQTGAGKNTLTLEAAEILKQGGRIILHTEKCGASEWLNENGIKWTSLDRIYEEAEDFDEHLDMAADAILSEDTDTVYCVMDLTDETVKRLIRECSDIRIVGQTSAGVLCAYSEGAYLTVSAIDIMNANLSASNAALITEIDSWELASDVKLCLMDRYPDESIIYLTDGESVTKTTLTELDRLDSYDHRTACLVPAAKGLLNLERYDFSHLLELTKRLRDPFTGCPWDSEQTHESLKRDTLEEAYELQDAIEKDDIDGIQEELGDVLFACALQICIGIEHGEFTETDVITGVIRKMISRHSHVFGNDNVSNLEGLFNLWDNAKKEEKGYSGVYDEMKGVANALPAILRAQKVLKRAYKGAPHMLPKPADLSFKDENAFGDYLLNVIEWGREQSFDCEKALEDAVTRYMELFRGL